MNKYLEPLTPDNDPDSKRARCLARAYLYLLGLKESVDAKTTPAAQNFGEDEVASVVTKTPAVADGTTSIHPDERTNIGGSDEV